MMYWKGASAQTERQEFNTHNANAGGPCWGKPWARLGLKCDIVVENRSLATSQSHLGPLSRLGQIDGVRLYCFGALLN